MNRDIAISVARNTTVMMTSQVVTWISSFILMLFLPRYLGSAEYGRLYVAISVTMMFQMVIEFGGQYFVAKEVSRSQENIQGLVVNSAVMRGMLWVVSLIGMGVLVFVAGYSKEVAAMIFILGCSKLWEAFERLLNSCFQGVEMMQYPCLAAIVERIFVTVTGVTALLLGANAVIIAVAMACSTLLNFLLVVRFGARFLKPIPIPEWGEVKAIAKVSLPYFLYSIFSIVYYRIDAVMLSTMTPDSVVGWYGAAYRFFDILMFFPSIYSTAVFPVMAKMWGKERLSMAVTTQRSLEFVLAGGLPVSIIVFFFSSQIIKFFFGLAEFGPSVPLLKIFSVGLLLVYLDFVLGSALFASDRQKQWTMTALLAVVLNPLLNLLLIPYAQTNFGNGGAGAAVATIVTEFFVMTMALVFLPEGSLNGLRLDVCIKTVAAGGIMAMCTWLVQSVGVSWILGIAVGCICYVLALTLLRTAERSEMIFLRDFFSIHNLKHTFVAEKGMST